MLKGIKGNFIFGENVKIVSNIWSNPVGLSSRTCLCVNKGATLLISNNVGISNSLIFATKNIIIEDNVLIGGGCQIIDSDFHSIYYDLRASNNEEIISQGIVIKKGAFIGTSSIILKGVSIGEQSVVAAGSVVSKSIPDFEIWGGNPAKFIRKV